MACIVKIDLVAGRYQYGTLYLILVAESNLKIYVNIMKYFVEACSQLSITAVRGVNTAVIECTGQHTFQMSASNNHAVQHHRTSELKLTLI